MNSTLKFLFCFLFVLFAFKLSSKVLIVAENGSDFTTIQGAVNFANPGDTVLVKAGIYSELVRVTKSGTEDKYITILGEPGATLDATDVTLSGTCGLIYIENKSFIRIIGLTIQNAILHSKSVFQAGIWIRGMGKNIEIRQNKISNIVNSLKNSGCHGIGVYGTNSSVPLSNIIIDGNEICDCQLGWSEAMVLNGNVDGFVVSNNVVHDNNNIGIDFIGFEKECPNTEMDQARNGICVDNHVYNITSYGNPAYGKDKSAGGIYVDGGKDILIERNIIDNCDIGVELASEHSGKSTDNIIVRNNFISRSYQGNLQAGGYNSNRGKATNCAFINNTTYQAEQGELVLQHNCNNIHIKNNIFIAKKGETYFNEWGKNNENIIVNNNIYWGSDNNQTGAWSDPLAFFTDPMLINNYLDMHLSNKSPAINKGIEVDAGEFDIDHDMRIIGGIIDIGADEYNPSSHTYKIYGKQNIDISYNSILNKITIKVSEDIIDVVLRVYDIQGQQLFQKSYHNIDRIIEESSISFPKGMCLFEIISNKERTIEKFQLL